MAAQEAFGIGGGGSGGGCEEPCLPPALAAATEAPVATEAPAAAELAPLPTEGLPSASEDTARVGETAIVETPVAKDLENASVPQDPPTVKNEAIIPIAWQVGLLVIGLISAGIAFAINQNAKKKWS